MGREPRGAGDVREAAEEVVMSDDDRIIPFPRIAETLDEFRKLLCSDMRAYTLVNRTPMPVDDVFGFGEEIAKRLQCAERTGIDPWRVNFTVIGKVEVSTVFIGMNHRFFGDGPPILFETMVFGGTLDHFQNRCSTWEEAEAMHEEAVQLVRTGHLKVVK